MKLMRSRSTTIARHPWPPSWSATPRIGSGTQVDLAFGGDDDQIVVLDDVVAMLIFAL
jgi:hypothetical protein